MLQEDLRGDIVICLHTLETFLPEYKYHYSLSGNNMFVLCHGLGPIQLQQASQEAKKCACRPKSFVKLCNKNYSSCNVEYLYYVEYLPLFQNVIPVKKRRVEQSTRNVSVFFFQKKECLFKIPLFSLFATDCWHTESFYHAATAIIKRNGNLGFTPPAAICFHCLRSVFALKPPDLEFLLPLRSPSSSQGFRHCMRVKRPVDFQMAPKKAVKGKSAAAEPTQEEGWNTSKCS